MGIKISWIKLIKILENIIEKKTGRSAVIDLHATTQIEDDTRVAVVSSTNRELKVEILLNFLYNQTLDNIIESLAYATASAILGTQDSACEFQKLKKEIAEAIRFQYNTIDETKKR